MFFRCSLVPTKKGNYTFSISTLEFAVPIDSAVPSRTLSWISVFNSTGEEINHAGSVISVLAGASLTLVVHLVDAFGVEVNTELLKDSVVVNVISYEDGNPVGFLFFSVTSSKPTSSCCRRVRTDCFPSSIRPIRKGSFISMWPIRTRSRISLSRATIGGLRFRTIA